ncbi:MAG TPA: hypothetical protein ENK57_05900 [Polyangiaceae bacterium]|nr:hypothetical protein [Polyangiaceae bacterium]
MKVTVGSLESIEAYSGPHAIDGIRFRPAAAALGVRSWGMNVLEIDAGCESYPEHDHAEDGQEELYVVLRGSATLVATEDGARHELTEGSFARVEPDVRRTIVPGPEGVTLLAIGGTPGEAYPS